jgi:hypothetical protein
MNPVFLEKPRLEVSSIHRDIASRTVNGSLAREERGVLAKIHDADIHAGTVHVHMQDALNALFDLWIKL